MTLITSISGIRGTIGGRPEEGLTPLDIVKFAAAYAAWINTYYKNKPKVVIGRDARLSGPMVSNMVSSTLIASGIDVIDLGLSTTPTVEMGVTFAQAQGGIIITASHNPKAWNALKLLNHKGEFISNTDGENIVSLAKENNFVFAPIEQIGTYRQESKYLQKHIQAILNLSLVNKEAIQAKQFRVAVDAVNSSGGIAVPMLLESLGVKNIVNINGEPTGEFSHNPEPLPEHLTETIKQAKQAHVDLCFVVDPDVDRLAIINEDGSFFGEEYTLVSIADYVLQHNLGNTVSNLSSTRALRDITQLHKQSYFASAVGEVNVVKSMKTHNAVIGGEGNGGIIYPELHYGRDALVGIALFLSHLATSDYATCSQLKAKYPSYQMLKYKLSLEHLSVEQWFRNVSEDYKDCEQDTQDGLKVYVDDMSWVHIRLSNTEPIARIYVEAKTLNIAEQLAHHIKQLAK